MFSFFLDIALDSLLEEDRLQALDPNLCMKLDDGRETPTLGIMLSFRIGQSSLQQDVLQIRNVGGGRLGSKRFIDILEHESVPITVYPAEMVDSRTNEPLPVSYFFWIPKRLPRDIAIDWERCEEYVDPESGVRKLTKLVLREDFIQTAPLLFVSGGHRLIHHKLQMQIEKAAITGVGFAPLDLALAPLSAARKARLEQTLQADPHNYVLWLELSSLWMGARRFPEALASDEKALALKPDLREGWERRADILTALDLLEQALEALDQALQLKPQLPLKKEDGTLVPPSTLGNLSELSVWIKKGRILQTLGRKEQALANARYVIQTWKESPLGWYALGEAHYELGHYEQALDAINTGLSLGGGPHPEEVYGTKGEILIHLGRYQDALDTYSTGLAHRPFHRGLCAGKAKVLWSLGREKEAIKTEQELRTLEQRREENLGKRPV